MLKTDWDDLSEGQKGDWYFHHDASYTTIRYGEYAIAWYWNGDKEKPTLSPSILIHVQEEKSTLWHGWLRVMEY